jgi:sugar transferase (PEP-CTERM/EpsH1 system associated)
MLTNHQNSRQNTLYLAQRVPYPPNKGEKIRSFHQIEYLLQNNHKISLACPYDESTDLDNIAQLESKLNISVISERLSPKYIRYSAGLLLHKPLSVSNFYSKKLQQNVDQLILKNAFDNIVCTSSSMAEYIFKSEALPKLNPRPRLIMDFMDLDSDKWRQYSKQSSLPMKWVYARESNLLSKYEHRINDLFDSCFFISQDEVDLFCKLNSSDKKPVSIGNGIDMTVFRPAQTPPQNNHPVLIFTGVMDYKPNVEAVTWFADKVWPRITGKYPQARFVVAGMNPVQSILELKKKKGIEVTGFVDDILPYYHQSDIFVAPLRIARGVQNKVLQAFSCGLPVIATSMGAEGIEYQNGTNILIADSAEDFFSQLDELVTNRDLFHEIRKNALDLVRDRYSWEGQLEKLSELFA